MFTTLTGSPLISGLGLVDLFRSGEIDITPWLSENTKVRLRSVDVHVLSGNYHYGPAIVLSLREPGNSDIFLDQDWAIHDPFPGDTYASDTTPVINYTPGLGSTIVPVFSARLQWHRCVVLSQSARLIISFQATSEPDPTVFQSGSATVCWERVTS